MKTKGTGIIRRIDDLGRIIIPKEIRRTLRIHEGDPMEIFVQDGGVLFKKYSIIEEMHDFAQSVADILFETTGSMALVSNKDYIIAVAGKSKRDFMNKPIWNLATQSIEERRTLNSINQNQEEDFQYQNQIVTPVICEGEVIGAIGLISKSEIGEMEEKMVELFSRFLSKQLEG